MAPRKPTTKKATGRKVYKPRVQRPMRSLVPADGTNLLCTSYFEISYNQIAAVASKLSYSLKIAPEGLVLTQLGNGVATDALAGMFANNGANAIIVADGATTGTIPLTRFAEFSTIYKQYRINSCKVSIIVDRECGLDNPLCFSASKNSSAPHIDMGTIVGGAHKQHTMTEARRTANYGWMAKETADKDFRMSNATLADADAWSIKVFQEVDAKANTKCKHRVSLSLNLTLKDSSKN